MILNSTAKMQQQQRLKSPKNSLQVLILFMLVSNSLIQVYANHQEDDFESKKYQEERSRNEEKLKRPERFTVVAPKFIKPSSDYHVLVSLANSLVPATVDLQLTGARDSNRELTDSKSFLIQSGETQTIKFSIPDWPANEYVLSARAEATDRSWNYTQEATLEFLKKSFSMLIQSDKAIYKAAQVVQFRALFLTQQLTPLPMREEINVTITNPKRNIIKQWLGLSNYRGLLSLELQLSEDPMIGEYTIKVEARNQAKSKSFSVAEYVLPTYDVRIDLPPYATYNDSDIVASVKASYTYGKPVNGHATLTVQPLVRFTNLQTRPLKQTQLRARLVNGTADFNVNLVKSLQLQRDMFAREIELFALVEEDFTGRKYNKTSSIAIHDRDIKIELINSDESFKPGLAHLLRFKVAYQDDVPVEDNGPPMELKYSAYRVPLEVVKLQPVGGIAELMINVPRKIANPRVEGETLLVQEINLMVNYRKQVYNLNQISSFLTKSEHYMQISLPQLTANRVLASKRGAKFSKSPVVSVNDELRIRVRATEGMPQVVCQGLARGDIVWALSRDAKNETEFEFDIRMDQRMTPETKILCFYVRDEKDKEIIADSIDVQVHGLVKNFVKISTSREEAKPGQEVEIGLLTKPNSFVGLLGIDQSVLLLKSGNDISPQEVVQDLKAYDNIGEDKFAGNAYGLFDQANIVVLTNNYIHGNYREMHFILPISAYYPMVFNSQPQSGKIVLNKLVLENEPAPPEFHLDKSRSSDNLVIRSQFPETWLWENGTSASDGSIRFSSKVPDTITSWALSAFSLNENFGLGLSSGKTAIRVFRPFFIKLNLPYSIIRGETVSIQAVIFNYSKRPATAKVTLLNANEDFEFVEAANSIEDEKGSQETSQSKMVRVASEDGSPVSFLIRPKRAGQIDIKMTAQSELAGDGLVKKLLVKPEGQTQFMNRATLINLAGPQSTISKNFSIEVPQNFVPDSRKVFVSVVGDVMGPGLSNVDDLLRLPHGCGEQNMVNLVPNIVIMNYLKSSNRLKEAQKAKALKNIETGYQRQLNYKRSDGSFSAFGELDKNGSVWLTGYVLKTLQQAKSIITVDEGVIRRAANFIGKYARADGSIEEVGMLHNKALQSEQGSSSAYLTAYSMIALLQGPIEAESLAPVPLDEVLEKGLNYLEARLDEAIGNENPYELSIIAYVLQLAKRKSAADRAYDQLWLKARDENEMNWWQSRQNPTADDSAASTTSSPRPNLNEGLREEPVETEFETIDKARGASPISSTTNKPPPLKPIQINPIQSAHLYVPDSLAIEMTAFGLLNTVLRGDLDRALPVVRWLINQQNSNGGFASTQDTVLAIEALAAFAGANSALKLPQSIDVDLIYPRAAQMNSIRRNNIEQFLVSQTNALVNQQTRLPDNTSWLQVKATGTGSAVVQVSWQYNLMVSAEKPAFYLNPILDKTSSNNYLQLSVCTYYKGQDSDSSNMALMDVELPSGYVADVEALPGLMQLSSVKRVETENADTKVLIYLNKVGRDELCLTVPAYRVNKVSNNKPVPVSIYDYYNRRQAARIFYEPKQTSSCDICEADSCSGMCSKQPKTSAKLISLHEQRKLSLNRTNTLAPIKSGNLTLTDGSLSNYSTSAAKILPLAPVVASVVTAVRNIYH